MKYSIIFAVVLACVFADPKPKPQFPINQGAFSPIYNQRAFSPYFNQGVYNQGVYNPYYNQGAYNPYYNQGAYSPYYNQRAFSPYVNQGVYNQGVYNPYYNQGVYNPYFNQGAYNPYYNALPSNQINNYRYRPQISPLTYKPFVAATPAPIVPVRPLIPAVAPVANYRVSDENNAQTLRQDSEISPDGSFQYSFETSNGIAAQAAGTPRNVGGDPPSTPTVHQGAFSWVSPEGKPVSITYVADENGYRAVGDAIPTPPPVPEAILKSIDYNRQFNREE